MDKVKSLRSIIFDPVKIGAFIFYSCFLSAITIGAYPQAASDPWILSSTLILTFYLLLSGRLANLSLKDPVLLFLLLLWTGWAWGAIFSVVPFSSEVTLLVLSVLPISYLAAEGRDTTRLLQICCALGALLAAGAIYEVVGPPHLWRARLFFDDQNTLGALIAFVIPLTLSFSLTASTHFRKIFFYTCLVILVGGLIATQSRSAFLGCIAGVGFILFKSRDHFPRLHWKKAWKAYLPLIVIFITLMFITNFGDRLFRDLLHDKDVVGRLALWQSALKMAMISPLHGTGLGIFHLNYPYYKTINDNSAGIWVHMDSLQWAVETGWATAFVFYALAGYIFLRCFRKPLTQMQIGAVGALVTVFLMSHTAFTFHVNPVLILCGILLTQFSPPESYPSPKRYILSFSIALTLLCGVYSMTRTIPTIYLWHESMSAYFNKDVEEFSRKMQLCLERGDPRFPGCYLDGAHLLIQRSDDPPPIILHWLDIAEKGNPLGGEANYLRADYVLKKYPKNVDLAVDYLKKSLVVNPTFWMARSRLVELLYRQGKYQEAYDVLEVQRNYWLEGQIYLDVNAMEPELLNRIKQSK